ncbi:putative sugar transporter [Naematelia encephala]|uniref:Putative sugar transporter n=1 Tax=Naematelia encephala TaxID=71784 RepID=A0A1Y2AGA6_9TREE|nr:putative sugar transporter [Naematelia encephala]
MLAKSPTGTWLPAWVPESSALISVLLLFCAAVESSTNGFDGSLLNGLNVLKVYTGYFNLTPATQGLNTASVYIGKILGLTVAGVLTDRLGRRPTIFWSSIVSLIGIVIQSAAQNIAMFVVGRAILGLGSCWAGVASAVYLTETFSARWRSWGVAILQNFYYVGALLAAGVTLGTGRWNSTWAWRAPSLFQGIFAIICIVILPFIPESPRWLVGQGRPEDAHKVLAQVNARGNLQDPVVLAEYQMIVETLNYERAMAGRAPSLKDLIRTPVARRRLLIGSSPGLFSCVAGNIIASYYLGTELGAAGITNANDKLKANVVLNSWCLVCCLFGTQLAVRWGRKPTALTAQFLLTVFLMTIGGLTKKYSADPAGASNALVYGNVACIFLFQGAYSVAWTPLMSLYPPEILNFSIRANGVAVKQYANAIPALVLVYVMPIGLANLGWKMYIINASWNIVTFVLIAVYWVETKGRSLEEIDEIFEGKKKHETIEVLKSAGQLNILDHEMDLNKETVDVEVSEVKD